MQVQLVVPGGSISTAEAVLESLGALVSWTEAADDEEILEPEPGTTPLWQLVRLTALFPDDRSSATLAAVLADRLPTLAGPPRFSTVADRDWDAEWRRGLRPLRFGARLWVCPGDTDCPEPGAIVIQLDPGLAFGTGTHATTAMCLRWLDSQPLAGRTVLDYGCGSGILAVAALRLGAAAATAIDIDSQALVATAGNARRNDCADRVTVLPPEALPPDARFDCLLANILSGPLIRLAPMLKRHVHPGTRIALSGILATQAAEVGAAFAPWVRLELAADESGWVLLAGTA